MTVRKTTAWIAAVLVIVPAICSCGYRPLLGERSDSIGPVKVPTARNETSYAGMSAPLTSAVRRGLARSGMETVSGNEKAAVLKLAIESVTGVPGMLGVESNRLIPRDIVWTVVLRVEFDGENGTNLIEPIRIEATGRSVAHGSVASVESLSAAAREEIVGDLAQRVVLMVLEVR
jgi:hypothetical protein